MDKFDADIKFIWKLTYILYEAWMKDVNFAKSSYKILDESFINVIHAHKLMENGNYNPNLTNDHTLGHVTRRI
jgi:hypothetical protein